MIKDFVIETIENDPYKLATHSYPTAHSEEMSRRSKLVDRLKIYLGEHDSRALVYTCIDIRGVKQAVTNWAGLDKWAEVSEGIYPTLDNNYTPASYYFHNHSYETHRVRETAYHLISKMIPAEFAEMLIDNCFPKDEVITRSELERKLAQLEAPLKATIGDKTMQDIIRQMNTPLEN